MVVADGSTLLQEIDERYSGYLAELVDRANEREEEEDDDDDDVDDAEA